MRTNDLLVYLEERFDGLSVEHETRAYIVGMFNEMKSGGVRDMSGESIVLAYAAAVQTGMFQSFQRVGDWCFWSSVFVPESLAEPQLVVSLGVKSYDACDRLMLNKWKCFNELTLRLPDIIVEVRRSVFVK